MKVHLPVSAEPGPLKVCVIGSTYPRHEGDYAVPWLRESIRHLVARGHRVTVLAPAYKGQSSHAIDGVPVHRFRYAPKAWEVLTHEQGATNKLGNPFLQTLGVPYVVMGSRAAGELARREQFDVIHSHWPFPHGAIASAARRACGAPVVANCHGAEFALARRKGWVRPLLRAALLGSDRIICNSSTTAADVRKLSGRDSQIIPYGTTVEAKPSKHQRAPDETRRILFTGRLIQRKGVEYLIRAMPRILERQKAVLVITGDGDQRARLEAITESLGLGGVVEFHGFVDNQTLDRCYAECDVYVNPSVIDDRGDTEGLGVGPIEAFAHGKPVVASAVGGIPDVVKDRRTGLLVPEKSPERLADAILELFERPDYARELARNGLEFSREQFDWGRITDSIEAVYRGAIGGRPTARIAREYAGTQ
ncbi:glycosyltransferase family 4 protein [Tundrisphaera lichenicola]|uniref:glycosyltransferase family 4 protein n=1 Tax=Tundrisphaera lichenicola TaxID=2029860 RepID=UPI003EC00558